LQIGTTNATEVNIGRTDLTDTTFFNVKPTTVEHETNNTVLQRASGYYSTTTEQSMYIFDDVNSNSASTTIYANGDVNIDSSDTISLQSVNGANTGTILNAPSSISLATVGTGLSSGLSVDLTQVAAFSLDSVNSTSSDFSIYPNGDIEFNASNSVTFFSDVITLDNQNIKNMANPVDPQDAATKNYIDTKPFLAPNMTTLVRDALTAVSGMIIFNTTVTKLQVYDGSIWIDLH
jgi:hypothetical protein